MSKPNPSYIAFEGGDGAGKSSLAALCVKWLNAESETAILTKEPGSTKLGASLREVLLVDELRIDPRAEALLMAADRSQHYTEVIRPALESGLHVVSDRSVYSSFAYQGGGREIGAELLLEVNQFALYGHFPDIVVYVDVPVECRESRLSERQNASRDRFESEGDKFRARVDQTFKALAEQDSERWIVVDGSKSLQEVWNDVRLALRLRLA